MTESAFNDLVDTTLERIMDSIEAASDDIDLELTGGILELSFDNGSKIIINRQTAMRELWVAARSGGFHFRHQDGSWRNTRNNGELATLLSQVVSEQAGFPVTVRV